ncbi:ROK family protein [Nocardioides sp. W3-2-3]|uniref:ROK family transcriptional regulator n=1 Tax=Nocardioides convexus TaxID=2712224 RepID=UPI00241848A7|nr:ROK family protein [Nocardioides convexus]NHA01656.1 ROK family protein [Nocardioides convexus]
MSDPDAQPARSAGALRSANEQRVLDVLRQPGDADGDGHVPHTQADIARATGLARATVSNIVRDLSARGLVDATAGAGRRGSSVRLSGSVGVVLGIDFGHSHLSVAVGDLTGNVITEERLPVRTPLPPPDALRKAREVAERLHPDLTEVRTVGLGLPAPVIHDTIGTPAIFPGWDDTDARSLATSVFGVPALVENDANLGALAEHRAGVARGARHAVFVKVSSGVGAGLILDDRVFHGAHGTAGEIGHLTLDDQGPLCRCGSRGCLEAYELDHRRHRDARRPGCPARPSTRSSRRRRAATAPHGVRSRTPVCTWAGRSRRSST